MSVKTRLEKIKTNLQCLIGSIAFILGSAQALCAWDCSVPSPQELIAKSDIIFYGKVLQVNEIYEFNKSNGEYKTKSFFNNQDKSIISQKRKGFIYTFEAKKYYKGSNKEKIDIISINIVSPGWQFKEHQEITIFAHRSTTGQFHIDLCDYEAYEAHGERYDTALEEYSRLHSEFTAPNKQQDLDEKTIREQITFFMNYGDFNDADKAYTNLLQLLPQDNAALICRADLRYKMGRYNEALLDYETALVREADNNKAHRGRTFSLVMLGRSNELGPKDRDFSGWTNAKHPISFANLNLANANFSEAQLNLVDFTGANLLNADFTKSKLNGINFSGADLHKANFSDAHLYTWLINGSEMLFNRARLEGVNFSGAYLSEVKFEGALLDRSDFSGAKLSQASFKRLSLQSVTFNKADLSYADFSEADLSGQNLSGLEIEGGSFANAKLVNVDLSNALLAGPPGVHRKNETLHGPGKPADLRGADLRGSNLTGTDLRYAMFDCKTSWPDGFRLEQLPLLPISSPDCPNLPRTALFAKPFVLRDCPTRRFSDPRAAVRGPEIDDLQFPSINLAGANLSGFKLWKVKFHNANFVQTDFRNADLQHSDFSGANLQEADLSGAVLWGTVFSAAKLERAVFIGAEYDGQTAWPEGFDPVAVGAKKTQ